MKAKKKVTITITLTRADIYNMRNIMQTVLNKPDNFSSDSIQFANDFMNLKTIDTTA